MERGKVCRFPPAPKKLKQSFIRAFSDPRITFPPDCRIINNENEEGSKSLESTRGQNGS